MTTILTITSIAAPSQVCFDLSRSIDFHIDSMRQSKERAIGGITTGLISEGERVTWKARHFLFWHTLTSQITEMKAPTYFVDIAVSGVFKFLEHKHLFVETRSATIMIDVFRYRLPLGVLGRVADFILVKRYMKNLLKARNAALKTSAESGAWRQYGSARRSKAAHQG